MSTQLPEHRDVIFYVKKYLEDAKDRPTISNTEYGQGFNACITTIKDLIDILEGTKFKIKNLDD